MENASGGAVQNVTCGGLDFARLLGFEVERWVRFGGTCCEAVRVRDRVVSDALVVELIAREGIGLWGSKEHCGLVFVARH
jgi:hypothetical protein